MYNIFEGFLLLTALVWAVWVLLIGTWKDTPKMCKCGKNPKCLCGNKKN
jgi:hypothetical protein